ncbi:DUF1905 domain-containing protein [Devosia sp.]|uniref:DUF1905 domain-containing protein n=1 Tax=Devosia sp. TaxID=1871048 RepID=UPI001B0419A3|nr:DUF1905 domain-containing protein [Devosia sp.]MBO9590017.1 DUF1905 domain-containing protein [Devosia sp.]
MAEFSFVAEVIHWRGPAPYYFARLPEEVSVKVAEMAKSVSYGWGVIPIEAAIGDVGFRTSLFPKDRGYLLPLKDAVRKRIEIPENGVIEVVMVVGPS